MNLSSCGSKDLVKIEDINISVYYYNFLTIHKMVNIPLSVRISITIFMNHSTLVNTVTNLLTERMFFLKLSDIYTNGITRNT
jgi:hypothetical protein